MQQNINVHKLPFLVFKMENQKSYKIEVLIPVQVRKLQNTMSLKQIHEKLL